MRRPSPRVLAIVGAVVLVGGVAAALAGPVLYRDVVVGRPAAAPSLAAQPEERVALSALPARWTVASGSYAGYRVDEQLNGTAVTVTARTSEVSGSVRTTGASATSAKVTVDLRKVKTNESARDEYFRTTAINTARHPTARFELTAPIAAPSQARTGTVIRVRAAGRLEINGRSKTVSVPLQTVVGKSSSQVAGSIPITFSDYGVTAPDLGFVKVQPSGRIEFLLRLSPRP